MRCRAASDRSIAESESNWNRSVHRLNIHWRFASALINSIPSPTRQSRSRSCFYACVSSLGVCGVRPPTTPSTPPSIPLDPIDSSLSSPLPTPLTPLPKPFYILHTKPPRPLGLSRLAHSPGNPSTGTCGPAAAITVPPQKKVPTSIRRRLRCDGRLRCPCCCCCSSTTAGAGGSGAPAAIQAKILKPFFFSSCSCAAFSNLIKFCRGDRRVCVRVNTRMVGFWILWPSINPTSKLRPNRTQPHPTARSYIDDSPRTWRTGPRTPRPAGSESRPGPARSGTSGRRR